MTRAGKVLGLSELLSSVTVEQFLRKHWPDRFGVFHGPLERLRDLTSIPEVLDLEVLMRNYRQKVVLLYPRSGEARLFKRIHLKRVEAKDALAYYEMGATLYLTAMAQEVPALREIARQVEGDLGLKPGSARMELFVSRAGSGTPPHFDPDLTFNIQLVGNKTWTVAKNTLVPHPLAHHKPEEGPPTGDARLYIPDDIPNEVPDPSESFEAKPGTMVYLPQGYWHKTTALADSIAITLTLVPPSWLDLMLSAIRKRLIVDPEWRRLALTQAVDTEFVSRLISEFPHAMDGLSYDEVARGLLPSENKLYELRGDCVPRLACDTEGGREAWSLHIESTASGSRTVVIPGPLVPFIRWLIDQKREFDVRKALLNAGSVPESGVRQVLELLSSAGVLRKI